ncbi:SPOR domain-containing protein [Luteimonas fraxinea]|uniref:SPOR domain-containing protein n=1 Tax=Luteimonas fraxinea TaxID=2901869 RepID=A0ABS8UED1_9GAMM|nr:SPOR domain-containing protein [Luteimonas fraxinea]MCD9097424.1 SPOR domain-containing protein [Luteimonas fraxinea]UHH11680.1 SPOR domain-containing protein [Luteimonas fraxinea]
MAARRGKTQARRNGGSSGGLPGWAWMIIGVVLALGIVLAVPRLLKPDSQDGFFRPSPNPDAQPAVSTTDADAEPELPTPAGQRPRAAAGQQGASTDYDFYTMLPEQEVPMTDAELAASTRAEAERQRRAEAQQQTLQAQHPDAADMAGGTTTTGPQPLPEQRPTPAQPATTAPATAASAAPAAAGDARYILQAGSFSASGDAEALKARIALLGLTARVESGEAAGRTVYRVRMGPYGTATDLAEAKQKLGNGGLPALAIKAQ